MRLATSSLLVIAALANLTPASAGDLDPEPQARLSWSIGFGPGQGPAHALTLDYRDFRQVPVKVLELDLAGPATQARLLGVPFYDGRYLAQQAEGGSTGFGNVAFDWRWVWWAVSGVVVAAVVIDKAGGGDDPAPTGTGGS
jgi:hypothetical protein